MTHTNNIRRSNKTPSRSDLRDRVLSVRTNHTVAARVMDIVLLSATIHNDAFSGVRARLRPCGTTDSEEGTTERRGDWIGIDIAKHGPG